MSPTFIQQMFSEHHIFEYYPFDNQEKVLVDVGANRGDFSQWYVENGWKVVAFEPVSELAQHFTSRFSAYPESITLIEKAVTAIDGETVPFYISEKHHGIHSLAQFHKTHTQSVQIETVRLDTVLQELQIPAVSMLKIDVEGADFLALRGFDFNKYSPEIIMMEFMDSRSESIYGYTHHDVVQFLNQREYVAFVSEWSPLVEYGTDDVPTKSHFLQFIPYKSGANPAWGNLIFVQSDHVQKLQQAYDAYIAHLNSLSFRLRHLVKSIPGTKYIYRQIRSFLK